MARPEVVLGLSLLLAGCALPLPPGTAQPTPMERLATPGRTSPPPTAAAEPRVDCAKVRPDVCRAVLDAALAHVPGSTAPNRAILGPPFERHYVVGGGSFGGTVLFLFEDGRQVLVLVRLAEGQGVHAEVWRGPIPTWYPTPRA